ncbi:CCR4-NOT transcription complex subunit 6-like [Oscarella lobularis]|uniref:CCR4-NOT transcription complex subunit 6-like n=1 Tax=Oscarella lobularis TaxID=121494 RepID=UPI0033131D15
MSQRPGTRIKYEPPDSRRAHTIMSEEDRKAGKRSTWHELEIKGNARTLSPALWRLDHLTALFLNDNSLQRIPADIARLKNLLHLDVSGNKLRTIPNEMGDMIQLRELLLNNNSLRTLPFQLGRLFLLQTLGLSGNPLNAEWIRLVAEHNGTSKLLSYFLEGLAPCEPPPERPWVPLRPADKPRTGPTFTVMCYNVLCDKYVTRQLYGYCPAWALEWEYRRQNILKEILNYGADIISLQEVQSEQYHLFFKRELARHGYDGIFNAKSRTRTMAEQDGLLVDGCAIFFRVSKFICVEQYLVEFSHIAMACCEGADDMLNRVMPKDNISNVALLELKDGSEHRQHIMVSNSHIHWDPEFKDVKLIQTIILVNELQQIMKQVATERGIGVAPARAGGGASMPLILCADLNSLPDSGVIEYLSSGRVSVNHSDFKGLAYEGFLRRFTEHGVVTHGLNLQSVYEKIDMPFTNCTFDFTGIIDYTFYTKDLLAPLGALGRVSEEWFARNKVIGCPNPHFSSDHVPLLTEFELTGSR